MKAAIYSRVSTDDKDQNPEVQLLKCRQYCELHNHNIIGTFQDEGVSGDTNITERPEGSKAYSLLHNGKADCLVVFSIDRFSRESPIKVLQQLNSLKDAGITFVSVTEPIFNMESEFAEPMKYMLAWFSNYFLAQHKRKVKAGIERARLKGTKSGKPIGRTPKTQINALEVITLRNQGMSLRKIAKQLNTNQVYIFRVLQNTSQKLQEIHT